MIAFSLVGKSWSYQFALVLQLHQLLQYTATCCLEGWPWQHSLEEQQERGGENQQLKALGEPGDGRSMAPSHGVSTTNSARRRTSSPVRASGSLQKDLLNMRTRTEHCLGDR